MHNFRPDLPVEPGAEADGQVALHLGGREQFLDASDHPDPEEPVLLNGETAEAELHAGEGGVPGPQELLQHDRGGRGHPPERGQETAFHQQGQQVQQRQERQQEYSEEQGHP